MIVTKRYLWAIGILNGVGLLLHAPLAVESDLANLRASPFGKELTAAYDKVMVEDAWQLIENKGIAPQPVTIGIIDTGVDGNHPEFDGVLDGATNDRGATSECGSVDVHGTSVAGIIGANNISSNLSYIYPHMNGIVAGVPGVQYSLIASTFNEFTATILDNAEKAEGVENVSQVVNMSFGATQCDKLPEGCKKEKGLCIKETLLRPYFSKFKKIYEAFFNAHRDTTLFIASAGNENVPAIFNLPGGGISLPNLITVGATTLVDTRTNFSNFGERVDIAAPGELVYAPVRFTSPLDENDYASFLNPNSPYNKACLGVLEIGGDEGFFCGTSASAPLVTGVAGLIKAIKPNLTPAQIKTILTKTESTDLITTDADKPIGRRLNAFKAICDLMVLNCPDQTPPLVWKRASSLCIANTPALGDDGRFYAPARLSCDPPDGAIGIAAFSTTDGSVAWGPIIPSGCSPNFGGEGVSVGANGLVYALGDWNDCGNGRLVAFNASNGSIVWDHGDCPGLGDNFSPHPRQTPALNEALNSIYFGSSYLCSVNMNSGANNWAMSGGRYIGEGGVAVDSQQNIYYGTNTGSSSDNFLRSFSSVGTFRWEQAVGKRGSKIMGITSNDTLLVDVNNTLVALDNTGTTQQWQVSNVTRPVIDEAGNIYVSSVTGPDVTFLNPDGSERRKIPLSNETVARVDFVDSQGHVYVRGVKTLYALNTSDGSVAWSFTADVDLAVGAVLAPGGDVFLSDINKTVYLLDTCLGYANSAWPIAEFGNRRHTEKVNDVLTLPSPCVK